MSSLHAPHTETQMGCNTSHSVNISQFLWLIAGNLGDKRFHSMRYRGPQRRRIGEGSIWWHFTPCLADKSWNLINSICIFIKTNMEGNVNPRGTLRNAIEKKIFHSVASHSRHTKWNSRKQVSYSFSHCSHKSSRWEDSTGRNYRELRVSSVRKSLLLEGDSLEISLNGSTTSRTIRNFALRYFAEVWWDLRSTLDSGIIYKREDYLIFESRERICCCVRMCIILQ